MDAELVRDLQGLAAGENNDRLNEILQHAPASQEVAAGYTPMVSVVDVLPERAIEILLYGLVVLLIAPLVIGSLVGSKLRAAEHSDREHTWWERILGAGDPPQAWDRIPTDAGGGAYLVARMKGDERILVGGRLGRGSYLSLSPSEKDIFLDEVWWLDENGYPTQPVRPRRAAWLRGEDIAVLHVIPAQGRLDTGAGANPATR
ncbi:MAG: DUF6338 family protein [Gaiellaceae bacterium]